MKISTIKSVGLGQEGGKRAFYYSLSQRVEINVVVARTTIELTDVRSERVQIYYRMTSYSSPVECRSRPSTFLSFSLSLKMNE